MESSDDERKRRRKEKWREGGEEEGKYIVGPWRILRPEVLNLLEMPLLFRQTGRGNLPSSVRSTLASTLRTKLPTSVVLDGT